MGSQVQDQYRLVVGFATGRIATRMMSLMVDVVASEPWDELVEIGTPDWLVSEEESGELQLVRLFDEPVPASLPVSLHRHSWLLFCGRSLA